LDVFEYELDSEMALYGAVPFMVAHGPKQTTGLLWLNAAETWIDITKPNATTAASSGGMFDWILGKGEGRDPAFPSRVETHWFSESGALEFFLLPGPRPIDVTTQYGYLTGGQQLPPSFAIGYHQCRWNYINEADVATVNKGFEEHNLPMDVLWLDIEHTDNKKYFTWHTHQFPTPDKMQQDIKSYGRKMVTIIDPHIKREDGYYIHSEATNKGLYVKNVDNQGDYEGWCWPGSSSWLDFFRPEVRQWWAEQYSLDKYKGSTNILYTWNDMNEPSVFNGPEVTMHKDAKHLGGQFEHRDVHNQYGFYMQMATVSGQLQRDSHRTRAFVLTRSFFVGSQRYGAVWTGDNTASWGHLKASIPMILSLNIAGIQFAGADVGGFFNNPDAQLLTRWYQAGAFSPFFREHAHIDTKRREPWLFGEPYLSIIREALRLRYSLLPYWYTLFEDASRTLTPVNRPLWFEFPSDSSTFGLEEDFLVGPHLLVHPITDADTNSAQVFLPSGSVWYDWYSHERHVGQGSKVTINSPLERIPILIRGGGIIPLKTRARRSTAAMVNDPYTLVVALDDVHKSAKGSLYTDDGESFAFQKGQFIRRHFTFTTEGSSASLSSAIEGTWASTNTVERIVVLGVDKAPSKIAVSAAGVDRQFEFDYDAASKTLTVRKPNTKISEQWTVHFSF
jgi:mannosyl-oligosaccharide alpha-1,3-glucosidase